MLLESQRIIFQLDGIYLCQDLIVSTTKKSKARLYLTLLLCASAAACGPKKTEPVASPVKAPPAEAPASAPADAPEAHVAVTIDAILLSGEKIVDLDEGRIMLDDCMDGAACLGVDGLFHTLRTIKENAGQNKKALLEVEVDLRVPFRTLTAALVSGGRALYDLYRVDIVKDGTSLLSGGRVDITAPKLEEVSVAASAVDSGEDLILTVFMTEKGVIVSTRLSDFPARTIPMIGGESCDDHDYEALHSAVVDIKTEHTEEDTIYVGAENDILCECFASMLNAVLWNGKERMFSRILVTLPVQ
jgi:hypothetical protein